MTLYSLTCTLNVYQQTVLEDLSVVNFAKGFRSGAGAVKFYRIVKQCEANRRHCFTLLCTGWGSIKFCHRFWLTGLSVNLLRKNQLPTFIFTSCIFLINTQTWYLQSFNRASRYGKFCAAVWQMTPFLLSISHVALIAIEMAINPAKATVAIIALGICLIDYHHKLPHRISWVLNKVLPLPLAAIVIYAGGPITRALLISEQIGNYAIPKIDSYCRKKVL